MFVDSSNNKNKDLVIIIKQRYLMIALSNAFMVVRVIYECKRKTCDPNPIISKTAVLSVLKDTDTQNGMFGP